MRTICSFILVNTLCGLSRYHIVTAGDIVLICELLASQVEKHEAIRALHRLLSLSVATVYGKGARKRLDNIRKLLRKEQNTRPTRGQYELAHKIDVSILFIFAEETS